MRNLSYELEDFDETIRLLPPNQELYSRTHGTPSSGHVDRYPDVEDNVPQLMISCHPRSITTYIPTVDKIKVYSKRQQCDVN